MPTHGFSKACVDSGSQENEATMQEWRMLFHNFSCSRDGQTLEAPATKLATTLLLSSKGGTTCLSIVAMLMIAGLAAAKLVVLL